MHPGSIPGRASNLFSDLNSTTFSGLQTGLQESSPTLSRIRLAGRFALTCEVELRLAYLSTRLSRDLRFAARELAAPDELLAHLSPMSSAHVGLTGDYLWADAATAGVFRPLNDPADRLYRAAWALFMVREF
ncbi:hypothetical protein ACN2C7_17330 [Caulobacter sp. ErkDOM-E]|uniref:hypothetical protein n=1 Tax=Caulobacter sp. ErkDOM-E TaxID=3402778 RepID=UPI003AF8B99B